MDIRELDVVELKSGEVGTILEEFKDGAFLAEIADDYGQTLDMLIVKEKDISKIIYKHS